MKNEFINICMHVRSMILFYSVNLLDLRICLLVCLTLSFFNTQAFEIFREIRKEFVYSLDSKTWIDKQTRTAAEEKVIFTFRISDLLSITMAQ